jgi:peptidoglycan hydrolase-like protein with peptidoglycan-binding domain
MHRRGTLCAVALAGMLTAAGDAHAAFGDRALRRGMHGHDVRVLQAWLTRLGFQTSVDGRFGGATRRSVRAYERRERQRVDGLVSRRQARGIRRRIERPAPATPLAAVPSATLAPDGRTAVAPAGAPPTVVAAIEAANRITDRPYRYGGGHASVEDSGYDCSGAVSYALIGAGLLDAPLPSSNLMSYGEPGSGQWITVYAHGRHAFVVIAGLRFDTSGRGEKGPRRGALRSPSRATPTASRSAASSRRCSPASLRRLAFDLPPVSASPPPNVWEPATLTVRRAGVDGGAWTRWR